MEATHTERHKSSRDSEKTANGREGEWEAKMIEIYYKNQTAKE